jgi:hypothetical protein
MPVFSKEDFMKPEVAQRLSVVIMSKMDKYILLSFSKLSPKEKKLFNKLMNEYIVHLGMDWENKLEADFNEVCTDELFSTENYFKAESINAPVGESEIILTEEQKRFQEEMLDPVKQAEWLEKLKADVIKEEEKMKERETKTEEESISILA